MINAMKIALAAAVLLGVASPAPAGEGSPDLSYPPGYENAAPRPQAHRAVRNGALDAYAQDYESVRPFSREEQSLFDRATGNSDGI